MKPQLCSAETYFFITPLRWKQLWRLYVRNMGAILLDASGCSGEIKPLTRWKPETTIIAACLCNLSAHYDLNRNTGYLSCYFSDVSPHISHAWDYSFILVSPLLCRPSWPLRDSLPHREEGVTENWIHILSALFISSSAQVFCSWAPYDSWFCCWCSAGSESPEEWWTVAFEKRLMDF